MDNILDARTTAFLIRSKLKYSIRGLCDLIKEDHPSVDIEEERKKYLIVRPEGVDLDAVVIDYLMHALHEAATDELPDDIEDIISENADIFFDIEQSDDDEDVYYINLECD